MPSPVMTIGEWNYLLDRRLREIRDGEFPMGDDYIPKFYSRPEPRDYVERGANITPMGLLQPFNGLISYSGWDQAYNWQATHQEFCRGVQIERLLYMFDHFDEMSKPLEKLRYAAHNTQQTHAATRFTGAFTAGDATFNYSTTEGVALCGTHTTTSSEADTSTGFVNRGTSALTWTSLKAAMVTFRRFKDLAGQPIGDNHQATAIVVPPELGPTAEELMGTKLGASGVNSEQNIMNVLNERYQIIVWNRLANTTNWFLINQEMMKDNQYFIEAQEPEYARVSAFDEEIAKFKVYGVWTVAASPIWQHTFGAQVT